jgi:autotransporter family porin
MKSHWRVTRREKCEQANFARLNRLAEGLRSGLGLCGIDGMKPIVSVSLDFFGWRDALMHASHKYVARSAQRQISRRCEDLHCLAPTRDNAIGIFAQTQGASSSLTFHSSGNVATAGASADGIFAQTILGGSAIDFTNTGNVATLKLDSSAIFAGTQGDSSHLTLTNFGNVATAGDGSAGIFGQTLGVNSPLIINNAGAVNAAASNATGINGFAKLSSLAITNTRSVFGCFKGIDATGNFSVTQITNSGSITAGSLFAIDVKGSAGSEIFNNPGGVITGFVDLTDNLNSFDNSGTFEARSTSNFGGSAFDQFINAVGGTVHATGMTSFVNLEQFINSGGLISTVDGQVGDVFRISSTVGGTDLAYSASGGARLAVDAALGPPGSKADNFIIDGTVTGKTELQVNNTTPGGGALNKVGIPVVFINTPVVSNTFSP